MIEPRRAMRLGPSPRLAIVGAGGKTSLLFRLADDYKQQGETPLLTATTHLSLDQAQLADHHVIWRAGSSLPDLVANSGHGSWLFTGPPAERNRLGPLPPDILNELRLLADAHALPLLIEADGARLRPLKAPAAHEPAIPEFACEVAVLAGLGGVDRPLDASTVHRPERFAALSGLQPGERITTEAVAQVLADPEGGLRNIPDGARRLVVLNQANSATSRARAATLGRRLLGPFQAVLVADLPAAGEESKAGGVLSVLERQAGIILAAGGSARFGTGLKQLAHWRGAPLVRHVALNALRAGLEPVIVVVGAEGEQVGAVLRDLPIKLVNNPAWERGQSTSLRAGLAAIPGACGAALFLLADQPQIPATLIHALMEEHRRTLAAIVAPLIDGRRGNPVLFDRSTFSELAGVEGDVGGRALFSRHPVNWIPWHDAGLLLDVDTPADLDRLGR